MKQRREQLAEGVTMLLGDCMVLLPKITDKVNLILTDPPYGVGGKKYHRRKQDRMLTDWDDGAPVMEWLPNARKLTPTVMVTTGVKNIFAWPKPDWIAAYSWPTGVRRAMGGGFNGWDPVLIYGKNTLPLDHRQFPPNNERDVKVFWHSTPKPLAPFIWLVETSTQKGDLVVDPFTGSGTTGVACIRTQRRFIGIEVDPKSFDQACKRMEKALKEPNLFIDRSARYRQIGLLPKGKKRHAAT